jgi:hypothetical protein
MKARKQTPYQQKELKPSLVPPWMAAVISAIFPGFGQILGRKLRRGLIMFFSFITIIALVVWRFRLAAPRDTGFFAIIKKAFHLEPILILITVLIVLFYLANIYDAYRVATNAGKADAHQPFLVFILLILVFFFIGWQIGEIIFTT